MAGVCHVLLMHSPTGGLLFYPLAVVNSAVGDVQGQGLESLFGGFWIDTVESGRVSYLVAAVFSPIRNCQIIFYNVAPIYFPTSYIVSFRFLHILVGTCYLKFLCVLMMAVLRAMQLFRHGFDLHFPND